MVIKVKEVLKLENITKRFGNVVANNNISFTVNEGEVHTLLGENGAGKSTLMNVLIGLYHPSSGNIYISGKKRKIDSPAKAVKYGIGMVHQHFMLVEGMTVFENIILGSTNHKSFFINKKAMKDYIIDIANKYGLQMDLDQKISDISVGAQQRVEILKILFRGASILVFDEPTAVLTDEEADGLFKIIKRLTGEKKSVIFISHKMREVMAISDRITILRHGEAIKTFSKDETDQNELVSLMIGREFAQSEYEKFESKLDEVVSLKNISYNKGNKHSGLNNINFSIRKGEILGIAGVDGNGQAELAKLVTDIIKPSEGEVFLKTKKISKFDPNGFIAQSISHIPEDRNKMGLVGNMSIYENLVLKTIETNEFSSWNGFKLKKSNILKHGQQIIERYDVRCSSIMQQVRYLSGGNQQKIILARELEIAPDLLIAVHPTRGLDIGATAFVHDEMIKARDAGCAILLISADFDEILKLSDRISVMFEGKMDNIFSGKNPPIEKISLAMTGRTV